MAKPEGPWGTISYSWVQQQPAFDAEAVLKAVREFQEKYPPPARPLRSPGPIEFTTVKPEVWDEDWGGAVRSLRDQILQSFALPPTLFGGPFIEPPRPEKPMTEQEWLESGYPGAMLEHLIAEVDRIEHHAVYVQRKISDRKLRLWAVGVTRDLLPWLEDYPEFLDLWAAASRFADGHIKAATLRKRWEAMHWRDEAALEHDPRRHPLSYQQDYTGAAAFAVVEAARSGEDVFHPQSVAHAVYVAEAQHAGGGTAGFAAAKARSLRRQADLLRCVAGNPFREVRMSPEEPGDTFAALNVLNREAASPPSGGYLDRAVLAWNGGTVRRLAETLYTRQQWEDMPVLADALEEAGCTEADVLDHLRRKRAVSQVKSNENCPRCGRGGRWRSGVHFEGEKICVPCDLSWTPGETVEVERPLTHCRGCWVLDLLLGKE